MIGWLAGGLGGKWGRSLMGRPLLAAIIFLTCTGAGVQPVHARERGDPEVSARAAVLMDYQTGRLLYSCRASKKMAPASTTKVLTALMGLELGRRGEIVTVSPYATATEGTSLGLRPGFSFLMQDLIEGALVNSGNDAAVAIGEHLAGNETLFSSMMTYKAKTIGAIQSNFTNPCGLDNPEHCCTAYDLALITRYALNNRIFRQFVQTRDDVIYERKTNASVHLRNTNRLLFNDGNSGIRIIGVKTGTTSGAGQCLVAAAEQDGRMLIAVVLDSADRYADTLRLLKYGYEECRWCVMPRDRGLFTLPVPGGRSPSVAVGPTEDVCFAVNSADYSLLERRLEIEKVVRAPLAEGSLIGKIDFYLGDRLILRTGLKTLTPVAKKSILF